MSSVKDDDSYYVIDTNTRLITKESGAKDEVVQYDDNSERFTFKIDDKIEGCLLNASGDFRIEIHYVNVGTGTSVGNRASNEDVYIVTDLDQQGSGTQIYYTFSWLLSQNATRLAGTIKFQIHIIYNGDSNENYFRWSTKVYSAINVAEGLNCTELVVEKNPDIIQAFEERIAKLEQGGVGGSGHTHNNKSVLDLIDDSDAGLTYDGELVATGAKGEGENSVIFNDVEGNTAPGYYAFAEGVGTEASGPMTHSEGWGTKASGAYQHVQGRYNVEDPDHKYVDIVGNGTDDANRSNASTLDWEGNAWFAGDVTVGAENKKLMTRDSITWKNLRDKPLGDMRMFDDIEYTSYDTDIAAAISNSDVLCYVYIPNLSDATDYDIDNELGGIVFLDAYAERHPCEYIKRSKVGSASYSYIFGFSNQRVPAIIHVANNDIDEELLINFENSTYYSRFLKEGWYALSSLEFDESSNADVSIAPRVERIVFRGSIKKLSFEYIELAKSISQDDYGLTQSYIIHGAIENVNKRIDEEAQAAKDYTDAKQADTLQEAKDYADTKQTDTSNLVDWDSYSVDLDGIYATIDAVIPPVTESNEGQFLRVVNGQWAAASIPIAENNEEGY